MKAQTILKRSRTFAASLLPVIVLALSCGGCQPAAAPPAPPPVAAPPAAAPTASSATVDAPKTADPAANTSTTAEPTTKTADAKATKLVVAMAADLRFVSVELQKEFEQQTPGITIEPIFGASGKLFAQIENKAPFDIFLSADVQFPEKLAEGGLTKKDSLFRYAIGHIVLWVRNDSPLPIEEKGAEILKDPQLKKVAIANPKTAPYGRAAEAALKKLGLYDEIQSKLVLGENIAQAAQFAETGAADAAVIGLSFASAPEFSSKGKYWKFPADSFPPLVQGGAILEQTQHPEAAKKFCDYLQSPGAQEIFKKYGFGLPTAP
ncbi:MAG: molybdenum transporter substrate-binding protein [Planctomycetaceae bacterium]|nr:molybdenum transporter substrate-binding protein [Planctomycetaceae bacterium]